MDLKVRGRFVCINSKTVQCRIIGRGSRGKARRAAPILRRSGFNFFRVLLGRIPWNIMLERKGMLDLAGWYSPQQVERKAKVIGGSHRLKGTS